MTSDSLIVQQSNVFYNYTLGFETTEIDLAKTAIKALGVGICSCVYLSDQKFWYRDKDDRIQFEWFREEGRQWDDTHSFQLESNHPEHIMEDLFLYLSASFHERRMSSEVPQTPYLRLSLPPILLERNGIQLPLYVNCKIFADGIAILTFQLDQTWSGVDEAYFIPEVVNLASQYYEKIWIDAKIQRLDAEAVMPHAFHEQLSVAGKPLTGPKVRRLLKRMQEQTLGEVQSALSEDGDVFQIGSKDVTLHQIVGTDGGDSWESNLSLCRSIYTGALTKIIVPEKGRDSSATEMPLLWVGRPAITLMRFGEQPEDKSEIVSKFGKSLSRILARSEEPEVDLPLSDDLRVFSDHTFHGERSALLWTWTRSLESPDDVWEDPDTVTSITAHQVLAELVEYCNMRLARACSLAQAPPSERHLMEAFQALSNAEMDLHIASNSGEINDALKYLVTKFGTLDQISSAKEAARWYLDEMRYQSDKRRTKIDICLTAALGLIGTTGLNGFLAEAFPRLTPKESLIASGLFVAAIFSWLWKKD